MYNNNKIKSKIQELRNQLPLSNICELCGLPLLIEEDHNYFHNKKAVHKECWMGSFGDEIEQHPLGYLPSHIL